MLHFSGFATFADFGGGRKIKAGVASKSTKPFEYLMHANELRPSICSLGRNNTSLDGRYLKSLEQSHLFEKWSADYADGMIRPLQ